MSAKQDESFRSYYGHPVIKAPVWKAEIPWYLFTGGLTGASAGLAFAARLAGNDRLARRAHLLALFGALANPILLILDLGRPQRFFNMLRVFKPTSPMSVGSWLLGATATSIGLSASLELTGRFVRLKHALEALAAVLGMPLATYTAALLADTAVPVWNEARRELPALFAASSAATAGAAAAIITPPEDAGPARRLAVAGGATALVASTVMEKNLGPLLAEPYHQRQSGAFARTAKILLGAGTATMAIAGRRRSGAVAGGALLLAGVAYERWAVFKAGFASANDPKYTIVPQRERARRNGS